LQDFLEHFSTGDIEHAEELNEYFRQMRNGLTEDDLASVACDLMDDPCPAGLDIVEAVEYVAGLVTAPMETQSFSNTLARAASGEIGLVLVSHNSMCSAKRCPSPAFRDGQVPIVLPGSQGVQWRHAIIGERPSASPLMKYQGSCKPCRRELSDGDESFVNVFYRNPRHTTFGEDGRVYPCTTDSNLSSGAPSPDSIICSDQDDNASGTDYGCDSDSRDLSPPEITISFANSSLGGGPASIGGSAQRSRRLRVSRGSR
jgi:hypothetical protein